MARPPAGRTRTRFTETTPGDALGAARTARPSPSAQRRGASSRVRWASRKPAMAIKIATPTATTESTCG